MLKKLFSVSIILIFLFESALFAGEINENYLQEIDDELNWLKEETIVITARKRPEKLQDVPVSVTALNSNMIEKYQVDDLGDVQRLTPNLSAHVGDAANAVVYIRGIGQIDSLFFADPGVGIYYDDVYLARAQGAFLDVIDIDRIEILRGPQGSLYGKNTIGGAVKFISAPLADNETKAKIAADAGNYNERNIKARVSGSLVDDKLFGKLSFASLNRNGFSENDFNGDDDGDKEKLAGRASMMYKYDNLFSLQIDTDISKDQPSKSRTPARETPVTGFVEGLPVTFPASDDPFTIDANYNARDDLDTSGTSATGIWNLTDSVSIKSITSYRELEYDSGIDLDATRLRILDVFYKLDQHQFSQELQFSYTPKSKLKGVAGLYYFKEKNNGFDGIDLTDLIAGSEASLNDLETTSYAVYGEASYDIIDDLSITCGLRYTKEKKDFKRRIEFYQGTPPPAPGTTGVSFGTGLEILDFEAEDDWSSFSPKIGLSYQLIDNLLTYVSAAHGFKSGGFDGRTRTAVSSYDPENLWSYETGFKSIWYDNRILINASFFYNDYSDLQLSSFSKDEQGNFSPVFTNAGKAVTRGVELEAALRPLKGLTLHTGIGFIDAYYKEYIGEGGEDISDEREFVNTPKWTAMLGLDYKYQAGNYGTLNFGGDVSYRSKTYLTVSSSDSLAQDGYELFNAFINYETKDKHWLVSLSGKNLADEEYRDHGFDLMDSFGYQVAYYGAPRTFSLSVSYLF